MKIFLLLMPAMILSAGYANAGMFPTQLLTQEFKAEGIVLGKELNKQNGVKFGQANFKGAFTVSERFDSNIYLTSNSKKTDFINEVVPKIFMNLPFGIDERHHLNILYSAYLGSYSNHTKNNYQNQDVVGLLNFKLPFGYLAFRDFFTKTSDRGGNRIYYPDKTYGKPRRGAIRCRI